MNILGKLVTEASASVTRAPENLWMDEDQPLMNEGDNTQPEESQAPSDQER